MDKIADVLKIPNSGEAGEAIEIGPEAGLGGASLYYGLRTYEGLRAIQRGNPGLTYEQKLSASDRLDFNKVQEARRKDREVAERERAAEVEYELRGVERSRGTLRPSDFKSGRYDPNVLPLPPSSGDDVSEPDLDLSDIDLGHMVSDPDDLITDLRDFKAPAPAPVETKEVKEGKRYEPPETGNWFDPDADESAPLMGPRLRRPTDPSSLPVLAPPPAKLPKKTVKKKTTRRRKVTRAPRAPAGPPIAPPPLPSTSTVGAVLLGAAGLAAAGATVSTVGLVLSDGAPPSSTYVPYPDAPPAWTPDAPFNDTGVPSLAPEAPLDCPAPPPDLPISTTAPVTDIPLSGDAPLLPPPPPIEEEKTRVDWTTVVSIPVSNGNKRPRDPEPMLTSAPRRIRRRVVTNSSNLSYLLLAALAVGGATYAINKD